MCRQVLFPLAGVLLAVGGCRSFAEPEAEEDLLGIEWDMIHFEQASGATVPIGATRISLILHEDGTLDGFGYSPDLPEWRGFEYTSTFDLGPGRAISVDRPEYIRPPSLGIEPHPSRWPLYWLAISSATRWEIEHGDHLTIHFGDDEKLHFMVLQKGAIPDAVLNAR